MCSASSSSKSRPPALSLSWRRPYTRPSSPQMLEASQPRMGGCSASTGPKFLPERMADDFLLSQPHDLAGRDRHAGPAKPPRNPTEVPVGLVLLTQAEVLARLGRILVDPELQRRLLGAGQRTSDQARAPEERVDTVGELVVPTRGADERRDLDADFSRVHSGRLERRARKPSRESS